MKKEELPENHWTRKSSCVLFVTFWDGNERKFWSGDARKKQYAGNLLYWANHLRNLCEVRWAGSVKEYAIYKAKDAQYIGDPIIKVRY